MISDDLRALDVGWSHSFKGSIHTTVSDDFADKRTHESTEKRSSQFCFSFGIRFFIDIFAGTL
jgi:hypothetical protein